MPFIKLKSDLASIKFGQDLPGGGSSDQPFMQFPNNSQQISDALVGTSVFFTDKYSTVTPTSGTPNNFLDLYVSNETSLDYPIRGGGLDFNVFTQTTTKLALVDKQRIQKFFSSKPRGAMFLQKQIALQFTNPKIQTGDAIFGLNEPRSPQLIENTRVFNNGINLLTQVGLSGTGTHIKRHGMFPINPLEKNYADIVINQPNAQNRLVLLSDLKMASSVSRVRSVATLESRALAAKLGISYNRSILFSYLGGPNSVYGIGATTIRRYEDTTTLSSPNAMSYDKIKSKQTFSQGDGKYANGDYDGTFNKTSLGQITDYRSYTNNAVNSFGKLSDTLVYNFTLGGVDNLNKKKLLYFDNAKAPWSLESTDNTKDIIKFVFEAIDNDHTDRSMAIFFRAFLTAFSDNHSATINTFKYFGRGEDFYTYQGVSRAISFGFKIAVFSKDELKPLYKKLNHLVSQVYPDYSQGGIMRAPLMRITIGDYLYRVAGLLENVNINVDGNTNWEIDSIEDGTDLRQLPRVVEVNCSFKPIQDFLPKRETLENQNVPYITEYKPEGGNWLDTGVDSIIQNNYSTNQADETINAQFAAENITINPNAALSDAIINKQFLQDTTINQTSFTTIQASDNEINKNFANRPRNYTLSVGDAIKYRANES